MGLIHFHDSGRNESCGGNAPECAVKPKSMGRLQTGPNEVCYTSADFAKIER
jgi:hypothetical protein